MSSVRVEILGARPCHLGCHGRRRARRVRDRRRLGGLGRVARRTRRSTADIGSRSNGAGMPARTSRARVTARSPYLRRIRVQRLGRLPPARVVLAEQRELLAVPEVRRRHAHQPDPLPVELAPEQADRRLVDRLGQVGRDLERRLARDRGERRVAQLERRPSTALSPLARSRQATPSAMPSSVRSITSRSAVSTSNVCSCPIDFAGSPVADRVRRRCPCARSTSDAPCLPNRRTSASGGSAARSPIVDDPEVAQRRRRLLADAPQARDRERREERRLARPAARRRARRACAGRTRSSRRASSSPTPTEAVRPTSSRIVRLDRAPDRLAVAEQRPRPGHVEERLVDRDRLDLAA